MRHVDVTFVTLSVALALAGSTASADTPPAADVPERRCSAHWRWLFPGLGTICVGQTAEGAMIATVAAAELGASVASEGHPVPVTMFVETYVYGLLAPTFELDRAAGVRFTPPEDTGDLVAAPFRPSVLGRTDVWAAIVLFASTGVAASRFSGLMEDNRRDDPIVFGRELDPEVGYPLAGAAIGGLHLHVAITEEALFRGYVQSGLARRWGEWQGWAAASALFGASHAVNLATVPEGKRAVYAAGFLPYATLAGAYLGHLYRRTEYSLSAPVAVHFWNNLITGVAQFVLDPEQTPFTASIGGSF